MPIVCGTDFSPSATNATTTAAMLAARRGTELHLVHVLAGIGDDKIEGSPHESLLLDPLREKLAAEAQRLQALGAKVVTEIVAGSPDEILTQRAESLHAGLIVVGSLGKRGAARWIVGSTAERTALTATCPVLVLREEDRLHAWLRGERPLRVMLGADFSSTTDVAIRFLVQLASLGPCEITAAQVVWPPEAHGRYGVREPMDLQSLGSKTEAYVAKELQERLRPLDGKAQLRIELRAGFGKPSEHLLELADRDDADLIVVGTHQRRRFDRFLRGSVSQGVLHGAKVAVISVPPQYEPMYEAGPLPRVGRVLASTDFSEHGDRATRMAYASLPAGGVVRLVHVVERAVTNPVYAQYGLGHAPKGDEELARSRLGEHLRSLVPPEAVERGIRTEVEVIESADPAAAIAQAAERFGADVVCMGSHGRTGLGKALVGSVTQGVIARTHRPVLVVKPPQA